MPVTGMTCCKKNPILSILPENGEGGIRTLGTLLRYGALAKRCFRPLSHLTSFADREVAEYRERRMLVNRLAGFNACRFPQSPLPNDDRNADSGARPRWVWINRQENNRSQDGRAARDQRRRSGGSR